DYGTGIIVSEATAEAVRGRFFTRELGAVPVKGKALPVKIFAVLPSDIRKYPRATLTTAATLVAVDGGRAVGGRTGDGGQGGVSVTGLPDDWPAGLALEIRCDGATLPNTLAAQGTIIWRRGNAAGIAFTTVGPDGSPSSPSM